MPEGGVKEAVGLDFESKKGKGVDPLQLFHHTRIHLAAHGWGVHTP